MQDCVLNFLSAFWSEMELGMSVVLGIRVLWGLAVAVAVIGLLPLGAVSEFVRDLSRRGKLKLASTAENSPVRALPYRLLFAVASASDAH